MRRVGAGLAVPAAIGTTTVAAAATAPARAATATGRASIAAAATAAKSATGATAPTPLTLVLSLPCEGFCANIAKRCLHGVRLSAAARRPVAPRNAIVASFLTLLATATGLTKTCARPSVATPVRTIRPPSAAATTAPVATRRGIGPIHWRLGVVKFLCGVRWTRIGPRRTLCTTALPVISAWTPALFLATVPHGLAGTPNVTSRIGA